MFETTLPFPADIAFVVHAGAGDPSPDEDRSLLPGERALLSAQAAPKRVREFALGRRCAREAMARLGIVGAEALPVLRRGSRAPRWPEGLVGAITHSGDSDETRAAAAVARKSAYRAVGLDLERVRPVSEKLLERIALPAERAWIAGLPPRFRRSGFALLFSAKESVYKALNPLTGVYLGYHDARIAFEPGAPPLSSQRVGASPQGFPAPPPLWCGAFRWTLRAGGGAGFPGGYTGEGRFESRAGWALTAIWLAA